MKEQREEKGKKERTISHTGLQKNRCLKLSVILNVDAAELSPFKVP